MSQQKMIFGKQNYLIMAIGFAVVVVGYLLMVGGKPESPEIYNPEVFSFRRITLAPTMVLVGFGIVMYAIFKKPAEENNA